MGGSIHNTRATVCDLQVALVNSATGFRSSLFVVRICVAEFARIRGTCFTQRTRILANSATGQEFLRASERRLLYVGACHEKIGRLLRIRHSRHAGRGERQYDQRRRQPQRAARRTVEILRQRPNLFAIIGRSEQEFIDVAESVLSDAVDEHKPWAIRFTLKTLGKKRGYGKCPCTAAGAPAAGTCRSGRPGPIESRATQALRPAASDGRRLSRWDSPSRSRIHSAPGPGNRRGSRRLRDEPLQRSPGGGETRRYPRRTNGLPGASARIV